MSDFTEGECLPTGECTCLGHRWPGVYHLVACCNTPHIDRLPNTESGDE